MTLRPDPALPAPGTAAPTAPAIQATGLRKEYPDVTAVHGIDLTIAPGESFGFLGPNGAGKTTTIAMLCALTAPTAGRIEIAGHDTRTNPAAARRRLGLIFQETTLDDDLTAAENLRFHADLYDVPADAVPARIHQTLTLVGLTGCRDRLVGTLSGGMRRRLEIARALLHRPQVLVLDEPTTGLDPQTRARIWQHLHHIRAREQVTLFLTTHYLDEADQCDRIAIIDDGRIVAHGSPAELKSALATDQIELRTGDDTTTARILREHFGITAALGPQGLSFRTGDGTHLLPRLIADIGVPIHEAKVIPPTLDDVFLAHTGHRIRDASPQQPPPEPAPPAEPPAAEPPAATPAPSGGGPRAELRALRMIWRRELLHFLRDRTGAAVSLFQPLVFLFIVGAGLAGLMPGLNDRAYQLFLFSGILVMAAQGPAIAVGASILWDRQRGFLREMLASPVRRATVLIGKCLGGATVATCQAALLLTIAGLVGIPYHPGLITLLLTELALTSLAMTVLGALVATFVRRPHTFSTMLSLLTAPLTFLSGAMFPLTAMPPWMAALALANPLTYAVDAIRQTIAGYLPNPPTRLFAPLTWGPWNPPALAEWALLATITTLALTLAARRFSHTT